jgi:hypothetical protein
MEQLLEAWQQVQAAPVEAPGTPHVWLDFKAPFADPPPVFVPKKPDPGPEPELVLPTDLQKPPVCQPPVPQVRHSVPPPSRDVEQYWWFFDAAAVELRPWSTVHIL